MKGDGLDDEVTRAAIAQATRLFGDSVDYCLAINGIDMARARRVVEWATEPVHVWRQSPDDNPALAEALRAAGCPPERFGYWWKWFPARMRPHAPEWILDGDQVVVARPPWFEPWVAGQDTVRVAQDDRSDSTIYGQYWTIAARSPQLYSGLLSLPPDFDFFAAMLALLASRPLTSPHDGRSDMSEQGCFAAAFEGIAVTPIPLHEFPLARAWEPGLDYGRRGQRSRPWGYHLGGAFKAANPHFARLVAEGEILSCRGEPGPVDRVRWLRNQGQWGREGWSMNPAHVALVDARARAFAGRPALEIGTSRGQIAALLALDGCAVTTLDREDRSARENLDGLGVRVEIADGAEYLAQRSEHFALIVVDLHGNDEATWRRLWPRLVDRLADDGEMVLYNSHLWRIPEWRDENGLKWVMETQLASWDVEVHPEPLPGTVICRRR